MTATLLAGHLGEVLFWQSATNRLSYELAALP
jgi:hypothetical protein